MEACDGRWRTARRAGDDGYRSARAGERAKEDAIVVVVVVCACPRGARGGGGRSVGAARRPRSGRVMTHPLVCGVCVYMYIEGL